MWGYASRADTSGCLVNDGRCCNAASIRGGWGSAHTSLGLYLSRSSLRGAHDYVSDHWPQTVEAALLGLEVLVKAEACAAPEQVTSMLVVAVYPIRNFLDSEAVFGAVCRLLDAVCATSPVRARWIYV